VTSGPVGAAVATTFAVLFVQLLGGEPNALI